MKERERSLSMERVPSSSFQFPPGFRFHPSDEELIVHYLQNKVSSRPIPASIIAEIELYKYNPWELPMRASFGEDEWYFFSPRYRKYPNGVRPNRAAGSGYWKATGTDKTILSSSGSKSMGVKKALVFYTGRPPKGVKTDWIMNEYRLLDATIKPSRLKASMRLDNWVLCRVQQKGNFAKNLYEVQESSGKIMGLVRILPSIGEVKTTQTSHNSMIIDYLNKDCRLLASILAGEHFPPIYTNSCVSFQESNKGTSLNSAFEEASDKMNSPITVSSFDNYNLLQRKTNEEESYDNFLQSDKRLNCRNSGEGLLPGEKLSENEVNYYSQNQSQDGFYNPNPSVTITEFWDHGGLPFTPKYLQ